MIWTEEKTMHVPTTVAKTIAVECSLVVQRRWTVSPGYTSTEYTAPSVDDLRRAANALGFVLVGMVGDTTGQAGGGG